MKKEKEIIIQKMTVRKIAELTDDERDIYNAGRSDGQRKLTDVLIIISGVVALMILIIEILK